MQNKMDVIGNNVANVNTTGFKANDVQFADLLTQTLAQRDQQTQPPYPAAKDLPLGHGVRPVFQSTSFAQGTLQESGQEYDLALDGNGFFAVRGGNAPILYTRNGKFHLDRDGYLVNDQGLYLLDTNNTPIQIPNPSAARSLIQADGTIVHQGRVAQIGVFVPTDGTGNVMDNPEGILQKVGNGLFTGINGQPLVEKNRVAGADVKVRQGFLEQSNVDLSHEMTELIQAQRAFQLNARAVQTEDQMMGMANNMRA